MFSQKYQEFCPHVGCPPRQTPGQAPSPQTDLPQANTPLGRTPWPDTRLDTKNTSADTPRGTPSPPTATAADGTHPTGMHSSFNFDSV